MNYDIFFLCKKCRKEHPLGLEIPITNGPRQKMTVASFYASKDLPEVLKTLSGHLFECDRSKDAYFYLDTNRLILVPVAPVGASKADS